MTKKNLRKAIKEIGKFIEEIGKFREEGIPTRVWITPNELKELRKLGNLNKLTGDTNGTL
jgi:hypothetical protein